jgi:hypothetical protein
MYRNKVKALYLRLCCSLNNEFPINISREDMKEHLKCMFMNFSDNNSGKHVKWTAIFSSFF